MMKSHVQSSLRHRVDHYLLSVCTLYHVSGLVHLQHLQLLPVDDDLLTFRLLHRDVSCGRMCSNRRTETKRHLSEDDFRHGRPQFCASSRRSDVGARADGDGNIYRAKSQCKLENCAFFERKTNTRNCRRVNCQQTTRE